MADEAVYAAGGETNKRKYEDSPPPVGRRSTGFSSPPDSAAPPPSYNSVPPPLNEIELAKQKVQEIAARILNNADPSKRARVENGAGAGGGYDAVDTGLDFSWIKLIHHVLCLCLSHSVQFSSICSRKMCVCVFGGGSVRNADDHSV